MQVHGKGKQQQQRRRFNDENDPSCD